MNPANAEVLLTLDLRGKQALRGIFTHYHKVDQNGKEINGLTTVRPTSFTECKKTVKLSNEFVRGAMADPPEELKKRFKKNYWRQMPAERKVSIHVTSYVRAMHPENRGFTMEIL